MGSLNGESLHDLDKESLFSPEKEAQNESGSCSGGSRACGEGPAARSSARIPASPACPRGYRQAAPRR